jgi:LysR family transcriptional activator of mexEF-oprN operon
VAGALASGLDAAVTVADEMPAGVRREKLFHGGFVCLFDPRHARIGRRLREREYFAHEHVIVSYNGDLRGIVEDVLQKQRRVRCSVSSFANVGALVDGTALLATIPGLVASQIRAVRPHLRTASLPFSLRGSFMELLWPAAVDDDDAFRFLRARIVRIARSLAP